MPYNGYTGYNIGDYDYQPNSLGYPAESFKISGISYHQEHITNLNIDDLLTMRLEPENSYDENAIATTRNTIWQNK